MQIGASATFDDESDVEEIEEVTDKRVRSNSRDEYILKLGKPKRSKA